MNFRRTAKDGEIGIETQTEHVRRRIAEAESAIEIESVAVKVCLEALRQYDLENVAGRDQFFRFRNHRFELSSICVAGRGGGFRSWFRIDRLQDSRFAQFSQR